MAADVLAERDRMIEERSRVVSILHKRWDVLAESMWRSDRPEALTPLPFNAGYFCFVTTGPLDPEKLAEHALVAHKVGVVPISSAKGIRVASCSVTADRIPEMTERIFRAARDLS